MFGLFTLLIFNNSISKNYFRENVKFFEKSHYFFQSNAFFSQISPLNVVGEVFFQSFGPSFLISGKTLGMIGNSFLVSREIREYIVKEGDNLWKIAKNFNLSLETLLWANNLTSKSTIKPGQKLIILPVSGILHVVKKGDTLSEIASFYKIEIDKILFFNGLSETDKIYPGDLLIIPGGKKPKVALKHFQIPLPKSYFICPIPLPCRITQSLHWFNAVDFSNGKCGEPVFAAAAGKVQRIGYNRVSGYYVRIIHPNGVVTFYGHLSKIMVQPGEKVYQGQIIGSVGYSGLTKPSGPAGCHLHFDVRFAENPFARYKVGTIFNK